jgi:hypothetical protein
VRIGCLHLGVPKFSTVSTLSESDQYKRKRKEKKKRSTAQSQGIGEQK